MDVLPEGGADLLQPLLALRRRPQRRSPRASRVFGKAAGKVAACTVHGYGDGLGLVYTPYPDAPHDECMASARASDREFAQRLRAAGFRDGVVRADANARAGTRGWMTCNLVFREKEKT